MVEDRRRGGEVPLDDEAKAKLRQEIVGIGQRTDETCRMERVWQRLWDRCGPTYSWAVLAVSSALILPIFVLSAVVIVAFEDSDQYFAAAAIATVATPAMLYVTVMPGGERWRLVERWAAGDPIAAEEALESSYALARGTLVRGIVAFTGAGGVVGVVIATIAGATAGQVAQWWVAGSLAIMAVDLIALHSYVEGFLRPVRTAIIADADIGDGLPRARPSFATWSNVTLLATAWVFAAAGTAIGGVLDSAERHPIVAIAVATGLALFFVAPITLGAAFAPSLRPIRDLAEGTARVADGDYHQRLPVVQDDDLGVLVASFNRMQAGLAERQRLHAAFGSYVDPLLAARLLEQGDEVFTGERRVVTVMFVDIRDFTPFAEAHTAEETVAQLNALFEILVPAVVDAGGHVNKYLGDGALAVFGAPNGLPAHADAALVTAMRIEHMVAERFEGTIRIGIGINTGEVIAGTIGGGGKLEFTLIGDTVNVAARIEQLTKLTGDVVLLTQQTLDALSLRPDHVVDRGAHELKGKAGAIRVFALGGG
ncbi:MAG TPA: adenylate/guanylate cyclase domain-containing protein [Acidimicrobiales bacterium]|nr:adenylate/guanylate cyclase domain-containing protein [Acidimicrobiales bacterium]